MIYWIYIYARWLYTFLCGIFTVGAFTRSWTAAAAAAVPRRLKFSGPTIPRGWSCWGSFRTGMREMRRRRGYIFPDIKPDYRGRRDSSSEFLILTRTFFAVHRSNYIYIYSCGCVCTCVKRERIYDLLWGWSRGPCRFELYYYYYYTSCRRRFSRVKSAMRPRRGKLRNILPVEDLTSVKRYNIVYT